MADGKVCSKCNEWKPFGEGFYRNASSPDGFYSVCKACRKPINKAWREQPEVAEREKQRVSERYWNNKEEIAVKRHERWEANKATEKARNEAYLEIPGNREKHRERCRDWAKRNPERMRAIVGNRRATKLQAEGTHTVENIRNLYDQQQGKCVYCGSSLLEGYHVDHIHPLSRGGSNWPGNLQLTCHLCNRMKGRKINWQFDRERYEKLRATQ